MGMLAPTIPAKVDMIGGTAFIIGLAVGAQGLGEAFFSIQTGFLINKFGNKKIMLIGMIGLAISGSISASVEITSPPSQPNSAQNIVARKLLSNKPKVDAPTSFKPSESAVTATKNKDTNVINVPKCNSLGLLSVYSDSEEEDEEIAA